MQRTLYQFHEFTGLLANNNKRCVFFGGVEEEVTLAICNSLQFTKGALPMKYLGMPLVATKLKKVDCDEFIKKICDRIQAWTSKFLSYAGRVQLIQSVLTGIVDRKSVV